MAKVNISGMHRLTFVDDFCRCLQPGFPQSTAQMYDEFYSFDNLDLSNWFSNGNNDIGILTEVEILFRKIGIGRSQDN